MQFNKKFFSAPWLNSLPAKRTSRSKSLMNYSRIPERNCQKKGKENNGSIYLIFDEVSLVNLSMFK